MNQNISDFGIRIGTGISGPRRSIADVAGVTVGHRTIHSGDLHNGVTAILPHPGNLFREKLPAAVHIMNGFGKSAGLMQIEELGTLETPILLTGTLNIGTCIDALIGYMLASNPDIGVTTSTVNPVVCECNDGYLSDAPRRPITGSDCLAAIRAAGTEFEQGSAGAGAGMVCFGLKGGIGSASRTLKLDGTGFTIGVLVLTNYGRREDFRLDGQPVGKRIVAAMAKNVAGAAKPDQYLTLGRNDGGSVIVIVATDLPLSSRQLARLVRRTEVGISRTGSWLGHDSGELAIGFSTANRIGHDEERDIITFRMINENRLNACFPLVAEAVEEAVLNSMINSAGMTGRDGHRVRGLGEFRHLFAGG